MEPLKEKQLNLPFQECPEEAAESKAEGIVDGTRRQIKDLLKTAGKALGVMVIIGGAGFSWDLYHLQDLQEQNRQVMADYQASLERQADFEAWYLKIKLPVFEYDLNGVKMKFGEQGVLPVPVVFDSEALPFNFQSLSVPLGTYVPEKGQIIISPGRIWQHVTEGAYKLNRLGEKIDGRSIINFDLSRIKEDALEEVLAHEGMHALLSSESWCHPEKDDAIQRHGDINMGTYTLKEAVYKGQDNLAFQELMGNAYGLMHAGPVAPLSIANALVDKHPSYQFYKQVLMREIAHAPGLDEELKETLLKKIKAGAEPDREFTKALTSLKNSEFYRIGQRIASLGLYLAIENPVQ